MIWSKPTACWREKIMDTVMNTSVVSKNTTVCVQIVKYIVMKNIVINIFNVVCSCCYPAVHRKRGKTPNFK